TAWEDDDEDHEDDEEDEPPLPEGHVMITWFDSNAPPVMAASELTVLDRAVFPGDIVARMSERQGQMGTVLGEVITYDLNNISLDTGKTIGEHHTRMNAE